jgi:hypothetical protein
MWSVPRLYNEDVHKAGLSVQFPSSSDNDELKVATVVRQTMKELSEAVSRGQSNDWYNDGTCLNATKWLLEFICRSK